MSKSYHFIPQEFQSLLNYYVQDPQELARSIKKISKLWWVSLCNLFMKLFAEFSTVTIGYALCLYFVKYLWFTYINTHAGTILLSNSMLSLVVTVMQELDSLIFALSFRLCITAFLFSFSVGLIAHFLVIKRYFYDCHGWLAHLSWVFGISILAGYCGGYHTSFTVLQSQVALLLIPVCCLLRISFNMATFFLPELTFFFQIKKIKKWIKAADIRNTNKHDNKDLDNID